MKKAFIVVMNNGNTYQNLEAGTIVGQCYVPEIMFQEQVDSGDLLPVEFNDEDINPSYIKSELIEGNWVVVEDTLKMNEDQAVLVERKKMEFGQEVLAYIGVLFNALTVEDYQTLLLDQEVTMVQNLLRQGALESSLALLDSYSINSIVTQEIKDKIASKIASFIAQV